MEALRLKINVGGAGNISSPFAISRKPVYNRHGWRKSWMKELLARLMTRPVIFIELIAASLFANLLALASSVYSIQVLNRYVSYGVDSTLATLTSGALLAIILEFGFRQVRL